MINGVSSGLYSNYQSYLNSTNATNSKNSTGSAFDYASVVEKANAQLQEWLGTSGTGENASSSITAGNLVTQKSLNADSSAFLKQYSSSMKVLDQATEKLRNGNLEKMLYDENGQVTDKTVQNTVNAVKELVSQYNDTIKVLNDNSDRGVGVEKQLARMVGVDPASEETMNMVGLSVNKDGTFALDEEKLAEALKTEDSGQRKLITDLIGGHNGIADKVHVDASFGSNLSSWQLVGNDVANNAQKLQEQNPFQEMYNSIKGNAYALNNMAYAGMFFDAYA